MAKVKLNPLLEQVRGQLGDLVFKQYADKTVLSRKPSFEGVEWSAAQVTHRERFRQAVAYAKSALADPEAQAAYSAAARAAGRTAFNLAVADFFHLPVVDEVDLSGYSGRVGDPITIRASDDFAVVEVRVILMGAEGEVLETDTAVETPPGSGRWVYRATTAAPTGATVRVVVTATDRPGGVGEAVGEKVV